MTDELIKAGDKGEAICRTCHEHHPTTFQHREFEMYVGAVRVVIDDLLLGICDNCGNPTAVPAQCTDSIYKAIEMSVNADE